MLDRIARDQTSVVCPVIDVIDDDTLKLQFSTPGDVQVGGFDWDLIVRSLTFFSTELWFDLMSFDFLWCFCFDFCFETMIKLY